MTIASVICEYNPFHNGHKYMFDKVREETGCDRIICIMSGDYVQRGEPAIYSKELRAKWALQNGADLVLELPLPYSTGASDLFSYGAVSILNSLGCVDYLCFGAKCNDLEKLISCNRASNENASIESPKIKELLKDGMTYAKARSVLLPEYMDILDDPNNILAMDYLNALTKLQSDIKPVLIKRAGASYDDESIDESKEYLSASAIRKGLINKDLEIISKYVPFNIEAINEHSVSLNDYSDFLFYSLIKEKENLTDYMDVNEDLKNRILKCLYDYRNTDDFILKLKSKNYTYARISRALLHIMLDVKNDSAFYKEGIKSFRHIRILGLKQDSSDLLKTISNNNNISLYSSIPSVITDFNDFEKYVSDITLNASLLRNKLANITVHEFSKKLTVI